MTEGYRLVKGVGDALHAGSDEQGIHAQLLRGCIGDHVAENDGVILILQFKEGIGRLLPAVNGYDVDGILHEFAENARVRRDIRKADDRQMRRIIFRHLDGSQNIVDGDPHFNYGKRGRFLQHLGCASAGDQHVIIALHAAQRELYALFKVADIDGQIDVRPLGGKLFHDDFHPAVGSDAKDFYFLFFNIRQKNSVHSTPSRVLL